MTASPFKPLELRTGRSTEGRKPASGMRGAESREEAFFPYKLVPYESVKGLVARAFALVGHYQVIADLLQRAKSIIYDYADAARADKHLKLEQAHVLAVARPAVGRLIAEHFASLADCVVLPVQPAAESLRLLMSREARLNGELIGEVMRLPMADGEIPEADAARVLPEIDALLSVCAEARARIMRAGAAGGES